MFQIFNEMRNSILFSSPLLRIILLSLLVWKSLTQEEELDYDSVSNLETQLPYDENGRLEFYQLVFPSDDITKNCPLLSAHHSEIYKVALTGEALQQVFPDHQPESQLCTAACLERGVDRSLVAYPMPHKRYSGSPSDKKSFDDWFSNQCSSVEVCMMNYYDKDHDLEVYWIVPPHLQSKVDDEEEETLVLNSVLQYGERHTRCIKSHLGHEFLIQNSADHSILDTITIEYPMSIAFGTNPRHKELITPHQFDSEIEDTLMNEWDKHLIPKRTFSALGFSHGKLPKPVFAAMSAFYYNNRQNKVREDWKGKGVFVNWWETDVFMIQIPWTMKDIWQRELADLVSAWTGVPCEQTVMYGLRQYETNARLLTHVDRLNTHVVSLIVNVAQGGLEEDWPVEVYDHYGRLHEVVMEPGDVVYYESAKNLHSRNRPLVGEHAYYTNLFTHYRPIGAGDNWYKDETEPGREPVLEVEGECVVPPEVTGIETEFKGYGRVKCQDLRLGSNISPSLHVAKSGEDLVAWWKRTTPENWTEMVEQKIISSRLDDKNENASTSRAASEIYDEEDYYYIDESIYGEAEDDDDGDGAVDSVRDEF